MVQYHMEVGYICHTFYDYKLAHEHLMAAKKCTGLQISLTGKPGERNLHGKFIENRVHFRSILSLLSFKLYFDSFFAKF